MKLVALENSRYVSGGHYLVQSILKGNTRSVLFCGNCVMVRVSGYTHLLTNLDTLTTSKEGNVDQICTVKMNNDVAQGSHRSAVV